MDPQRPSQEVFSGRRSSPRYLDDMGIKITHSSCSFVWSRLYFWPVNFKKDSYFSDSKVFFLLVDVDLLEMTMMIIFVLNSRTLTSSMLKTSNQQPKLISMTMLL